MLRIEFQLELKGMLSDINSALEQAETIEFDNALPVDESRWLMFATVTYTRDTSIDDLLESISDIQLIRTWQFDSQPTSYRVIAYVTRPSSILTTITRSEAVPHRITMEEHHVQGIATVRDWDHLKEVAEAIETSYGSFELLGTTEVTTIGYPLGTDKIKYHLHGKLTEDQLEILKIAYQMGYFKVPQEVTGEEVAEELNISRSTLSERLRRTEDRFCEILFGGIPE